MLFYKKNPGFVIEVHKDAPRVGTPYVVNAKGKRNWFYENDPAMNRIIGGYSKGPEHSYAKELIKRYPLSNE